jgi:hypothetical protein
MLSYPDGGRDGGSMGTFFCVSVAACVLIRRDRKAELTALIAPIPLTLAAAILHRYPYGGEARTMQFVAPGVCLLMGLGLATMLEAIRFPRLRLRALGIALFALAGLGIFIEAGLLRRPYRLPYDERVRAFARRFWPAQAEGAEVACIRWDFGVIEEIYSRGVLNPKTPVFLCNQLIYSPGRYMGGPRWDLVSASHPLRCVLFHETAVDQPELVGWLRSMEGRFDLRRCERIELDVADPGKPPNLELIHVFEFTPRAGADLKAMTVGRPAGALVR